MANIVSPDWVIKHLAKGVAAGPDTTQPGDNANKALKTAFLSKHFYDAAGGVVLPEPRLAGKYLSNDGTNLFWADAPAALPTINPTGDDGKVVVRVNGEFTYRHIVPHPYPAGQTLFNDGSNLVWRNLPDLPTVDPTDEGKVLVVENNTVTWKTLVSGGSTPLPETAGNTGLVLSNDGTALNDGASLRWSTSSGETEKPPGTVIGYAHAYSIKDDSGDNTFTLEASVYPDHLSVIGTLKDPGGDPYQVLQWGNTSVVSLDGSPPFGEWVEDGVFEFSRDCFVIATATQHIYANYDAGTGYTVAGDVYLVYDVDTGDGYRSFIVGGRAGVNFGSPYNPDHPPTVGGSFSCAITVATGDALSVKGLFVTVGGTGGTLDYGAIKTYVRPTFGILAMEGFPMPESEPMCNAAGEMGFGVGVYPYDLPEGFSELPGTRDIESEDYGNYQYSDGSIMVFVPKFYYRIGSPDAANYSKYGLNVIEVACGGEFADEAEANAAGYALHRAFKDGGEIKSGFFIDKYLASKDGTDSCKSIPNADPISLVAYSSYNPSRGMTGCTGILADAVVLSRARGVGRFNVASIFMYDALAKLCLAHGQAATGTATCAWYDAVGTNNFPKGCNTNFLGDYYDSSVTYARSYSTKPKTRAITNFAKTTHNGQASGVADINGSMYQAMLGLTMAGTSATSTASISTGDAYLLKPSVALASLTGGFGGSTDAWGTTDSLAANYDLINGFLPWGGTFAAVRFGNGSNQVFSGATSGTDYLRSWSGIGNQTGMSASGTNLFGSDRCHQYGRANLFPMASGNWADSALAGVFYRFWSHYRSLSSNTDGVGFRSAAYAN
jgi:hypothetical protein